MGGKAGETLTTDSTENTDLPGSDKAGSRMTLICTDMKRT